MDGAWLDYPRPRYSVGHALDQLPARPDRHPAIQWDADGTRMALRVYRNRIYLEPAVWIAPMPEGHLHPQGLMIKALRPFHSTLASTLGLHHNRARINPLVVPGCK